MPSIALLLIPVLVACAKPRAAHADSSAPRTSIQSSASSPTTQYSARGTVRSIDADKSLLWIAHEDIPGYMKAMTMPFVAWAALRRDLRPGDRVEFSFHDDSGTLVIETLSKL